MPLYEYECEQCGHRFEVIQKFSDPPVEKCPKCGSKVRKLIASPAIQFKGTGWYVTDYAKKDSSTAKSGKGSTAESSKSNESASGGEAKSETKTEKGTASESKSASDSKPSGKT
jgi:putative FmdB family regulatory protein